MDRLQSQIDPASDGFKRNHERMLALVRELRERTAAARRGGGEKYLSRQREQGKLPARDRIDRLLDRQSPFSSSRRWPHGICTTTTRQPRASSPESAVCPAAR